MVAVAHVTLARGGVTSPASKSHGCAPISESLATLSLASARSAHTPVSSGRFTTRHSLAEGVPRDILLRSGPFSMIFLCGSTQALCACVSVSSLEDSFFRFVRADVNWRQKLRFFGRGIVCCAILTYLCTRKQGNATLPEGAKTRRGAALSGDGRGGTEAKAETPNEFHSASAQADDGVRKRTGPTVEVR